MSAMFERDAAAAAGQAPTFFTQLRQMRRNSAARRDVIRYKVCARSRVDDGVMIRQHATSRRVVDV